MNSSLFLSVALSGGCQILLLSAASVGHNWNHLWIRWNSGILASPQNPKACYFLCFFPPAGETVTSAFVSPLSPSLSLSLSLFSIPRKSLRGRGQRLAVLNASTYCRCGIFPETDGFIITREELAKSKSNPYFSHMWLLTPVSMMTLKEVCVSSAQYRAWHHVGKYIIEV